MITNVEKDLLNFENLANHFPVPIEPREIMRYHNAVKAVLVILKKD